MAYPESHVDCNFIEVLRNSVRDALLPQYYKSVGKEITRQVQELGLNECSAEGFITGKFPSPCTSIYL